MSDTAIASTNVSTSRAPSLVDLRDQLRAAGLGRPRPVATFIKFFVLISGSLFGFAWTAAHPELSILVRIPLALVSMWLLTGASMCGHDGAHGATSNKPWVNTLLAQLGFTLLGGLSVCYWRYKHNSLHHPNVNVGRKDPDIEQSLLAMSTRQHREQNSLVRFLQQRFQGIAFWLIGAPLVLVDLKVTSLRFIYSALRRGESRGALLADLAWVLSHYVFWIGLPLLFLPLSTVLIWFAIVTIGPGFNLIAIFGPAHMPYPVVKEFHDPLLLQLMSTRNLKTNWFFRQTLIGLDLQVEHHLAPTLPHFDLPRASEIVRAYCARHGLPYNESGWLRALWDTTAQVQVGWNVEEIVVGAPEPVAAAAPVVAPSIR